MILKIPWGILEKNLRMNFCRTSPEECLQQITRVIPGISPQMNFCRKSMEEFLEEIPGGIARRYPRKKLMFSIFKKKLRKNFWRICLEEFNDEIPGEIPGGDPRTNCWWKSWRFLQEEFVEESSMNEFLKDSAEIILWFLEMSLYECLDNSPNEFLNWFLEEMLEKEYICNIKKTAAMDWWMFQFLLTSNV